MTGPHGYDQEPIVDASALLSIEATARKLRMSRQGVTQWAKRGRLRRVAMAGGRWGYVEMDVLALAAARRSRLRVHCPTCQCPGRARKGRMRHYMNPSVSSDLPGGYGSPEPTEEASV